MANMAKDELQIKCVVDTTELDEAIDKTKELLKLLGEAKETVNSLFRLSERN